MKKSIFIIFIILFSASTIFSQKKGKVTWMSLAVKGGYGSSLLIHKESMEDSKIQYNYFSPAFFVGGRFGLTFGNYIGVSSELLYQSFSQKYGITAPTESYQKQIDFKALEFDILLRFTSPTGFYAQIGPKFTKILSINQFTTGAVLPDPNLDLFAEQKYLEKWTNLIFEFGFMPYRNDRLEISIGLRGAYGFKSIINDESYFVHNDGIYFKNYLDATTNPATLQAVIEINYMFGYFGIANCGKFKIKLFE